MDKRFGRWNVSCLLWAGLLMTAAKEISKHKFDLVEVKVVRWDRNGTKPAGEYKFFYRKVNENHQLSTSILYIREPYQQLRG
jgi:hypothetical protein